MREISTQLAGVGRDLVQGGFATTTKVAHYIPGDRIGIYVGLVIQAILGLIGVIFLIMIVYGGVMWLTSEGEEKKVGAARNMITQAVVGLIFSTAAYAITVYVTNALGGAAGFRP